MLEKLFKKSSATKNGNHPALRRLDQMGAHSADCTMVRNAEGKETRDEIGPVSFYRRHNRLFTRDQALYLAIMNFGGVVRRRRRRCWFGGVGG